MDQTAIPVDIERTRKTVQESLAQARVMTRSMFDAALGSDSGFNAELLERMQSLDLARPVGAAADAQAVAEFLVYSRSPLRALFDAKVAEQSSRTQTLSALVVQAALAEQQNADHSLRDGRVIFDAHLLERTLEDWVLSGAHRAGAEAAPLTQIAKTIDLTQTCAKSAMETRFGCVIPVVVSAHLWGLWQAQQAGPGVDDSLSAATPTES